MRWKNLRRLHIWIYLSMINVKLTRKECLDKIQEAVDNLDTLLAVIKSPSKTTIRWDCEVYADEADKITNALNALQTNYGNETREEFCIGLDNE